MGSKFLLDSPVDLVMVLLNVDCRSAIRYLLMGKSAGEDGSEIGKGKMDEMVAVGLDATVYHAAKESITEVERKWVPVLSANSLDTVKLALGTEYSICPHWDGDLIHTVNVLDLSHDPQIWYVSPQVIRFNQP